MHLYIQQLFITWHIQSMQEVRAYEILIYENVLIESF